MTLQTEADYIRAQGAANILKYAWALYNADWTIVQNETDADFVTSDNPAALIDPGDDWAANSPFYRILPITPRICLSSDLSKLDAQFREPTTKPDFRLPPAGTVKSTLADTELVSLLNAGVAMCAEDLVLSSRPSDYARDLAATHAKYRLEAQTTEFISDGEHYFVGRIRAV